MTSILQKPRVVADLSELPLHGMGSASLTWWGTLGFMLIEGSGFALVLAVYLYLASIATEWPLGAPPPDLLPGTIITVLLLLSLIPNMLVSRWARQEDLRQGAHRPDRDVAAGALRHWCRAGSSSLP